MDLQLKDVAALLNVSQQTLRQWVSEGRLPAYQLNRQYRFNRLEIEEWILRQKLEGLLEEKGAGNLQFSLFRAIHHGYLLHDVEASSKEELIAVCMERMASHVDLDPHVLTDLFIDRERMMPTGLGYGIAIPHTRDFLLNTHHDVILVVFPKQPLDYGSLDGLPVHTCFFLFACDDRRHLNLLSKIAHLSSSEEARNFLQQKPSKEQLLAYVKEWEMQLAHHPSPKSV